MAPWKKTATHPYSCNVFYNTTILLPRSAPAHTSDQHQQGPWICSVSSPQPSSRTIRSLSRLRTRAGTDGQRTRDNTQACQHHAAESWLTGADSDHEHLSCSYQGRDTVYRLVARPLNKVND